MHLIYSLPSFVKIGASFAVMLALNRFKLALGWAMLISTVLLTLFTGSGWKGLSYLAHSFIDPQNYLMLLVIVLLTFFSDALAHTGRMEKALDAFRSIFKNQRLLMGALPAVIGLLPMPGGALFSAPFLSQVDENKSISPERKSAINYWFRHLWEYWWPLYPGVILAVHCSGLPFGLFLLVQAPFTIASITGGWYFLLRQVSVGRDGHARPTMTPGKALWTLWPIILLVLISIVASIVLPHLGLSAGTANLYGMLAGIFITLVFVFKNNGALFLKSCSLFCTTSTWLLVLVIVGVLAFSTVLQMPLDSSGNSLVSLMRDEFIRFGIPLVLIVAIIPFISALVTGFSVGFVGASFPIVFALLGRHPSLNTVLATTSLTYVSGYIGLMLSPVHLCFIMSNDFFKVRMAPTYRYILGPCAVVAIAMVVLCTLYYIVCK
jgi:integral membrane protein (TIGR00529 family)